MYNHRRLHEARLPTPSPAAAKSPAKHHADLSIGLPDTDHASVTSRTQRTLSPGAPPSSAEVLSLQRHIGNQRVVRLLAQRRAAQAGATSSSTDGAVQRYTVISAGQMFGDLIELDADEALPTGDGYRYKPASDSDSGLKRYWRQKAGGKPKSEIESAKALKIGANASDADKQWRAQDAGFSTALKNLFVSPTEGTFEYVAQYLYDSIEQEALKKEVYLTLYKAVDDGTGTFNMVADVLPEDQKTALLQKMINGALKQYGNDTDALLPGALSDEAQKQNIAPEVHEKSASGDVGLPNSVAIGFHGTDGAPSTVSKSTDEGGWGGLKRPQTVPFFRTRYALDAPWNPLDAQLNKGAHYRQGKNWDNELLSTVSIATKATPAIKFPFPRGASDSATTWIYATVVEKAYPTFKIQTTVFPEVAVNQVDPENIIGYQIAEKRYDPSLIKHINQTENFGLDMTEFTAINNEKFAYNIGGFIPNWQFATKWGSEANIIAEKAAARIKAELGENQWGIYDSLKITKK